MRWTDEQIEFRRSLRRFVENEVLPLREELEFGEMPPYGVLRRFYDAFGVGDAAMERFEQSLVSNPPPRERSAAETLIPIIELSRACPGIAAAHGVSVSLTAGAILRAGTEEQKRRWVPDLLTLRKIGAWAITEPDSGSDAFGALRCTARRSADGWIINGSKTFITNGPYADTLVVICKDGGSDEAGRPPIMTFVLDRGMDGLTQTGALRKMGLHSSPIGELAFNDVYVEEDRLLRAGPSALPTPSRPKSRDAAKATFATERASIAAMALGMIERCLELSVEHARTRVQFGRRIGDFQLIQHKLAFMEVARLNVENLVLGHIGRVDSGSKPTLTEASAMKLYAAGEAVRVALDAVQVLGGAGYMCESHVEQLARDAKVLQIYGGTDEIQITHVAKGLLGPS